MVVLYAVLLAMASLAQCSDSVTSTSGRLTYPTTVSKSMTTNGVLSTTEGQTTAEANSTATTNFPTASTASLTRVAITTASAGFSTTLSDSFTSLSTILETTTTAEVKSCPLGFTPLENSCYRWVGDVLSWFEAGQYCTLYGGNNYTTHLVQIESENESVLLTEWLRGDPNTGRRAFWIGLSYIDRARSWVWAPSQKDPPFGNWAPGQPQGVGNCALINPDYTFRWQDADCSETLLGFICESPL